MQKNGSLIIKRILYIVINDTVKQKIKIQYRLKCAKIKYSQ